MYEKNLSKAEAKQLTGLSLAYIGDTVYEAYVREKVILTAKSNSVFDFHKRAVRAVNCHAQSRLIKYLIDNSLLTEEEIYIYRRGKNSKAHTIPKNSDRVTYMEATGFEALIGFLYMTGDERLNIVLDAIKDEIIKEIM